TDRWRTRVHDAVEQTPPVELQNPTTHQGMGGKRVGTVLTAIEQQNAQTGTAEQHRCGCAGSACTDDHSVVANKAARNRRSFQGSGGQPASTSIDTGTPLVTTS